MEMIPPNCLQLARKELATITFNNGFELPETIQEVEANHYYACVGVRARDSKDGFTKIYDGALLWASRNKWNKMNRQISQGVFKRQFADVYDKIIVLHNPTKQAAAKPKAEKAPPKLSNTVKGKIKKAYKEGATAEAIAEELGQDVALVSAYINDKLK